MAVIVSSKKLVLRNTLIFKEKGENVQAIMIIFLELQQLSAPNWNLENYF